MTDKDALIAERPRAIAYYNHLGPGGTLYWAENLTPDRTKGFKPLYSADEIVLAKREALAEAAEIVREIGREFPQRMPLCMEIVSQMAALIDD